LFFKKVEEVKTTHWRLCADCREVIGVRTKMRG